MGKKALTTFEKMKAEYAAGASMKELARKYRMSENSVSYRARRGGWAEARKAYRADAEKRAMGRLKADSEKQFGRICGQMDKLLDKIDELLEEVDSAALMDKPVLLRQISGAILDCQHATGAKSELERAEQDARIAMLRAKTAQAEREAKGEKTVLEVIGLPEGMGK